MVHTKEGKDEGKAAFHRTAHAVINHMSVVHASSTDQGAQPASLSVSEPRAL